MKVEKLSRWRMGGWRLGRHFRLGIKTLEAADVSLSAAKRVPGDADS